MADLGDLSPRMLEVLAEQGRRGFWRWTKLDRPHASTIRALARRRLVVIRSRKPMFPDLPHPGGYTWSSLTFDGYDELERHGMPMPGANVPRDWY